MGDAVTWYEFPGATPAEQHAAFVAWHDPVCAAEQIPHPGRNQGDGSVAVDAAWTTAYADALQLTDGRLVVNLADDDPYSAGLTPTTVDPDTGLDGATVVSDAKQIPDRWRDPETGAELVVR
jgi:hypothetical protein